jgi:biopolymer transport protein ExbD
MTTLNGKTRPLSADPNVTPLIDVLLVLLVIFMIVTPTRSRGLHASVPQPATQAATQAAASPPDNDVVITVLRDKTVLLNHEVVTLQDLDTRLKQIFAAAPNHVLFVRGDRDLDFQQVAEVIDVAKGAGLNRIGLMTK